MIFAASMVRYSILDARMHFVHNMCAGYIDPWPSTFARRSRIAIIDGYNLRSRQKAINPHCPTDPMWRERESNTDQRDIEQSVVHLEKHRPNVSKADSRTDPTLVTALIRYIYKELAKAVRPSYSSTKQRDSLSFTCFPLLPSHPSILLHHS